MGEDIVLKIAVIGALGVGSQWLAWRYRLPAIVLMAVAGLLAGPVSGFLDPVRDFGPFLKPVIGIAVAIILFEGGLNLRFSDLRGTSSAVRRLVTVGVLLAWVLGGLAAHHLAGLSWPTAWLFAGIMTVTGPTVIVPLLRQTRLAQRPAALLKWEGIINDPTGALLAVFVYEYLVAAQAGGTILHSIVRFVLASLIVAGLGVLAGRLTAIAFRRGYVAEYLKAPTILCAVIALYALANLVQGETGLLAVTAMGVTIANARIASIEEMRRFKENVAIILVSAVFVILSATLNARMLESLDWRIVAYLAAMVILIRPVTVWLSTVATQTSFRERLLVSWIAPRGIVAVAVSAFFGPALVDLGYADGSRLTMLAFALVFVTIIAHGFTLGPLARALSLSSTGMPGVLFVGATPFSVALARALSEIEFPVMIADTNWHRLRAARHANLSTYYGEILSETAEERIDFARFAYLVATTDNDAYNALVCTQFAPELGRNRVYQLSAQEGDEDDPGGLLFTLRGRTLLHAGIGADILNARIRAGWQIQRTRLTDAFTIDAWRAKQGDDAEIVGLVDEAGTLHLATEPGGLKPKAGVQLLGLVPPSPPEAVQAAPRPMVTVRENPA